MPHMTQAYEYLSHDHANSILKTNDLIKERYFTGYFRIYIHVVQIRLTTVFVELGGFTDCSNPVICAVHLPPTDPKGKAPPKLVKTSKHFCPIITRRAGSAPI